MYVSLDDLDSFLQLTTDDCNQLTVATCRQNSQNIFDASHQNLLSGWINVKIKVLRIIRFQPKLRRRKSLNNVGHRWLSVRFRRRPRPDWWWPTAMPPQKLPPAKKKPSWEIRCQSYKTFCGRKLLIERKNLFIKKRLSIRNNFNSYPWQAFPV